MLFIFDLDDVLYEYDMAWRLNCFANRARKSVQEIIDTWYNSGWEDNAECGAYKSGDDYLKEFNNLIGADFSRDEWVALRRDALTPISKNLELAKSFINNGHEIAVLTNNAVLIGEEFERITPLAAQIFGKNMHCSAEFGARKPSPLVFESILDKYKVAPSEAFFFDDRLENIIGAKRVGLNSIQFKKGTDLSSQIDKTTNIAIEIDPLESDDIKFVLNRHLQTMHANSPPESVHALDLSGLKSNAIRFWSLRFEGKIIGCGALKTLENKDGEIKSMHILQEYRGRGFAKAMLEHILAQAANHGFKTLLLETGSMESFIAARELYKSYGFKERGPFGDYVLDPNTCFFELLL